MTLCRASNAAIKNVKIARKKNSPIFFNKSVISPKVTDFIKIYIFVRF